MLKLILKYKGIIKFISVLLIILMMEFILYKNIDKVIQNDDGVLYHYSNESKDENVELIFRMHELVMTGSKFRELNDSEIDNIKNNEVIYLIIKKVFDGYRDEELIDVLKAFTYTEDLENTIYGNLKVINVRYDYGTHYKAQYDDGTILNIVYSEDMNKIYYCNEAVRLSLEPQSYDIESVVEEESVDQDIVDKEKIKIVDKVTESLSEITNKYEFNPDTIINKGIYYILKDTSNDITVYYSYKNNIIWGFYIGFEK